MIVYPEEFKQKVLTTLVDTPELRQRLDAGQEIVGRILDDSSYVGVTAEEIVAACESLNFGEIYKKAKRQIAIKQLYIEWKEIANNQLEQQQCGPHM